MVAIENDLQGQSRQMTLAFPPTSLVEGDGAADAAALPLAEVPVGARVRVTAVLGGKHLLRRLGDLGVRVGAEMAVINRRGDGVLVRARGPVVALGGGVARKVLVLRLEA